MYVDEKITEILIQIMDKQYINGNALDIPSLS